MDNKSQLYDGKGDYRPSERANAAVSTGHSGSHGAPDHADVEGRTVYKAVPKDAEQPSNQHTGGTVMGDSQRGKRTFEEPGKMSSGYGTGVEKGTM